MNLFALKPHPYSKILPEMSGSDFAELVASIKKLGRIRNAVIVYHNQILDGNQRLRACKIAKVEPRHIEVSGTDAEALEIVWDLNVQRRQLTPSARAVAFAEYCKFLDHGQHPSESVPGSTLDEAAKKAHVSKNTMRRARKVVKHGTKKQIKDIKKGKTTVKQVASEMAQGDDVGPTQNAVDKIGIPIPEESKGYWDRRIDAITILSNIANLKKVVKALDANDVMWSEVNLNGALSDLSNVYNRFKAAVPAYVCPYCQGVNSAKCTACKGRGVISKHMWNVAVPEEIKAMQEKRKTNG